MMSCFKRTGVALLATLTLSAVALATPAPAATSAWRDHHGGYRHGEHWRGGLGCEGAGC